MRSDLQRQRREAKTWLVGGLVLLGTGMATAWVGLSTRELGVVVTLFGLGSVLVSYFLIVTGVAALQLLGSGDPDVLPQQEPCDRIGGEPPS